MPRRNDSRFYFNLLKIFSVLALIGMAILLYTSLSGDPTDAAFSLIAFVISVAALMMTTLQSLSISRQLRITEQAMRLVRETDRQLEELVDEDRKLSREIRQDIALDRQIVEVLEEVGVGDTAVERREVAGRIARRIETK